MSPEHIREYVVGQPDYDSQTQRPTIGPYVQRSEVVPDEAVLKRLEDIDISWVLKYVTNVLTGYKKNNGGLGAAKYNSQTNGLWVDSDGEVRQITETWIDKDNYYGRDISGAQAKLPYLLKRLHQKSRMLGCSVLSIYGRYLCCQQVLNIAIPKPKDMLAAKIYKMNSMGYITEPYGPSANHNRGFPEAFAFIRGADPDDPYYADLTEFGYICDLLGIKLWMEDPREYDQKFINTLVVTYISTNQEFLWHGKKLDRTVLGALRNTSVSDYAGEPVVQDECESFVERCNNANIPKITYGEEIPLNDLVMLLKYYTKASGDETFKAIPRTFHTCDGFICAPYSDMPYLFNTDAFNERQGKVALLHRSGYFLQVCEYGAIPCLSSKNAITYIQGHFKQRVSHRYPEGWGKWET